MRYTTSLIAVLTAAWSWTALAQENGSAQPYAPPANSVAAESEGSGAIPNLPLQVQSAGGITYLSGGVGDEELAEFKAKERDFNVQVLISAENGDFVSDVGLVVLDNKGTAIASIGDAGPFVYMRLPAGRYTLKATPLYDSVVRSVKIHITGRNLVKEHFTFKEPGGIDSPHKKTVE